jgi:flagellin
MAYRISSSNTSSLTAERYLDKAQRQVENSLGRLASGTRILQAGDDAAGFAISESLRGQLTGNKQAKFNAENAISLVQTAEGGLNEQNNILIRLRELAVYSASDTLGDDERTLVNNEFQQLVAEFDRIAKSTRFGSKDLLVGDDQNYEFQVGAYKGPENVIQFKLDANTTASNVGITGLDVSDKDDARDSISSVDDAIYKVASTRANLGAAQSRFQYAIDNLSTQAENIQAARSIYTDTDYAEEAANLAQGKILQEAGISVLAQANGDTNRIMRLIG